MEKPHAHRSTNERTNVETSGAPALVLVPSTEDGAAPLTDWQVRCISSGSPGYLAVEVEQSSWAVAPDKYSAEALVCLFEDVRDGVPRMVRALPDSNEPRFRWRLGLALAGAAAVCALAFALLRPASVTPPPDGSELLVHAAPTPMSQEVPTDSVLPLTGISLEGLADGGQPALTHPMPRKAYKGQKRPPCTPRVEVEIVGGCWMPHQLKAPCPEELHEYQGQCYSVVVKAPPPPQSLGQ